jgi:Ca2+-binding RTX toxin-like protein
MANRFGTTDADNLTGTTSADVFYMTADDFTTDTVSGGAGSDTINYMGSAVGVKITLTNATMKGGTTGGYVEADSVTTFYNPNTHSFQSITHHQTVANLSGIENATGSSYDDTLNGNGSANVLSGRGGEDIINGGGGADTIIGGAGFDQMTGGTGNDTFVFNYASDGPMSATTYTEMDTITDFVRGEDKIDLSALVNETAGNHALSYIDTANFSGVAGQVRETFTGYGWLVQADLDGDLDADFQVMVNSTSLDELHAHLQASDFILA